MTAALLLVVLVSLPFIAILVRRPVLRRLALRNAVRRPREAALVFRHVDGKRHALRLSEGAYRFDGESGAVRGP